jgi:two-component system, OmpR family, sensor kinase
MRSLRARLVVGLMLLVGVAVVLMGFVSYTALRSYLLDQIDGQLDRAAAFPVMAMREDRPLGPPPQSNPDRPAGDFISPSPVYVELRDESGDPVRVSPVRVGDHEESAPNVPEPAAGDHLSRTTAPAEDGSFRYRLLTVEVPGRGWVIVGSSLKDADATLQRLLVVEAIAGVFVLSLVGLIASRVVRLGLRPLDHMAETAGAIAAGDLSLRVTETDPRTEVGRLGTSFNAMIGQIETAFDERAASQERLRRFVADASHELRTPLTTIRGYAELYRSGAVPPGPELDRAMSRVEAEAQRLGVLVEDLLVLARLDQGRPLDRQPVDLAAVLRDAVDDTHAVEPGRPVTLDAADGMVVIGERGALLQVTTNLLANAREHTPARTPVEVRLHRDGERAVVEVTDHGPGMPEDVAEHVFDRFYRADPARTRALGGTGLGLAIVAGIVEAHGGTITVTSRPGEGSTFSFTVPLAPA